MSETVDGRSVGSKIIRCPRCKVPAHQLWGELWSNESGQLQIFFDEASDDRPQVRGAHGIFRRAEKWKVAHCQACDQKTLWRGAETVYPVTAISPAPHPSMDRDVKALYEEAGRVLPISRRAGAALVRAALEKQIKLLDPDAPRGARLDERINRLSGQVSTPLGELLDIIRHVGNASLHGSGDDELVYLYLSESGGADDIAEMLFDAINDLVDELVARPLATKSLWDKLPDGVRKSIAAKRDL